MFSAKSPEKVAIRNMSGEVSYGEIARLAGIYAGLVSKRSVYILEGRNTPGCIATYAALLSAGMSFLIAEPGKANDLKNARSDFRFSGIIRTENEECTSGKVLAEICDEKIVLDQTSPDSKATFEFEPFVSQHIRLIRNQS